MAHDQFEVLHPFNDGNGRIGRLLVVVQLCTRGSLSQPLLTISPWFEARRGKYQDRPAAVSGEGDWDGWVAFFAAGVAESCDDTIQRVDDLLLLRAMYVAELRVGGLTGLARDVVDMLIARPFLTARSISEQTGRTYQAASTAIGKLVDLGILREATGRVYNRMFEAVEVVQILIRPSRDSAIDETGLPPVIVAER
jgi:Fic family protein